MILLDPKVLALLALLGIAILVTAPRDRGQLRAGKAAVERGSGAAVKHWELRTGELERLKAQDNARADAAASVDTTKPRPPEEPFTIEQLLRVMDEVLASVPRNVPNLPMMSSLAHAFLKHDKEAIVVGPVPPDALGVFETDSRPNERRMQIRLSPDLQELHRRGVPLQLIAPVLVHELDHLLTYLYREDARRARNTMHKSEGSAFNSMAFFLHAMYLRGKLPDGEAVDAQHYDPAAKDYLKDLKRIREKLFAGELPDEVKQRYGEEDHPVHAQ